MIFLCGADDEPLDVRRTVTKTCCLSPSTEERDPGDREAVYS